MRSLELDFRVVPPASPWAGRALLVLALVFGTHLALSYRELRDSIADQERRLAGTERRAHGGAAAARVAGTEEIAFARDTVQRLATPWDNLFGALESAANDKVALLAIEPDPKSGSALISAEAKDYLAALSYVLQLQDAPTLTRVRLVRHELRPQAPPGTVAFTLSVSWSEPK